MIKCQGCGKNPATVHLTEIIEGEKRERHLCESCAVGEGIAVGKAPQSLNEWLSSFVMQQAASAETAGLSCPECGTNYSDFRQRGLLGCPACYASFEKTLLPLIERAHENASHHVGKVPPDVDRASRRQYELIDMRRRLRTAVETEDYEEAAKLRDRIKELESP
jgi:protein arginine kinase activator